MPKLTRVCSNCKEAKDLTYFYKSSSRKLGHSYECKVCTKNRSKDARETIEGRRSIRNSRYKRRYGITLDFYEVVAEEQNNKCCICDTECKLVVEHNHATGVFRGLTCQPCNVTLGMSGDSIDRLQKCINYLKERGSYEK